MEVVNVYLIFFLIVFAILAIVVAYKLLQVRNHDINMARYYKHNHITNDDITAIRRRFKQNRKLLEEVEKEYEQEQNAKYIYKETERKELIAKRVFAYDYEDMLYQIYAPTAKHIFGHSWQTVEMEKECIIQRISEIKQIPFNMAENVFETLLAHDLIYQWHPGYYTLTQMLASDNANWDIVTDTDMNLDKRITEHHYERKQ